MRSLQRRVERYVAYWRPVLGLGGWNISLRFDERKLQAYCKAQPKYLTATLGFNVDRIKREVTLPLALEELVLHEMVHAVIWRASETAVSQMTFALLRARDLRRKRRTT